MPKHTKKRSTIKRKHRRMKEHAEANKKPPVKATSHGTTRMTVLSITYKKALPSLTALQLIPNKLIIAYESGGAHDGRTASYFR